MDSIRRFSLNDLPSLRHIRISCYGDFDALRFARYVKKKSDLVYVLDDKSNKGAIKGYLILYERGGIDGWIYQLGCSQNATEEEIDRLIQKAEEVFKNKNHTNIRILLRDHFDPRIKNVLQKRSWEKIDSIWIMERDMTSPVIPNHKQKLEFVEIREANPEKDIDGVVHVDRAAFIFGHRVPKQSLLSHLSESGAFVAVDTSTNDESVVGYNYNTLDNNEIGHFIRLATLPDYRRNGIASELVLSALAWFKTFNIKKIYLRTIPESAGSILYKKFGFIHIENESTYEIQFRE